MIGFEESIENRFSEMADKLDDSKSLNEYFALTQQSFLELIDKISKVSNGEKISEMNLVYDKDLNKLCLYDEGVWDDMLVNSGITKIIKYIQSYYLNNYESYLH